MSRLTVPLVALGVLLGAMLLPQGALAKDSIKVVVSAADIDPTSGCEIHVNASWDASLLPGPSVTVTLYRSVDGETFALAGQHVRTENDSADLFPGGVVASGKSYRYQVAVSKGPKHVIGFGESEPVSCDSGG